MSGRLPNRALLERVERFGERVRQHGATGAWDPESEGLGDSERQLFLQLASQGEGGPRFGVFSGEPGFLFGNYSRGDSEESSSRRPGWGSSEDNSRRPGFRDSGGGRGSRVVMGSSNPRDAFAALRPNTSRDRRAKRYSSPPVAANRTANTSAQSSDVGGHFEHLLSNKRGHFRDQGTAEERREIMHSLLAYTSEKFHRRSKRSSANETVSSAMQPERYAPETRSGQVPVAELVEDTPLADDDDQGRNSPWMNYARTKIERGALEDNRSAFAKKYVKSRVKFVKQVLASVLKTTVDAVHDRSAQKRRHSSLAEPTGTAEQAGSNPKAGKKSSRAASTGSAGKPKAAMNGQSGRPLTLWAAKSLIPLLAAPSLEHERWIEAVSPLLEVLDSLPPLSLGEENTEMIESLQHALLQPHNVLPSAKPERRRIATSTALATALHHGSLGPLIAVVRTLLEATRTGNPNDDLRIDGGAHLGHLRAFRANASAPAFGGMDVDGGAANHMKPMVWQLSQSKESLSTNSALVGRCSLVLCEGFLYCFFSNSGFCKIGTGGASGTLQGYVYATNTDVYREKEQSSTSSGNGSKKGTSMEKTHNTGFSFELEVSDSPVSFKTPSPAQSNAAANYAIRKERGDGEYEKEKLEGCLFCNSNRVFMYSQESRYDGDTWSLGTLVDKVSLKLVPGVRIVVKGERRKYSAVYSTRTYIFALRARETGVTKTRLFGKKNEKKKSPGKQGNTGGWESLRGGNPLQFDVYRERKVCRFLTKCRHGDKCNFYHPPKSSNDNMLGDCVQVTFSHTITLKGNPTCPAEKEWLKENGGKSELFGLCFFATTDSNGKPLIAAGLSTKPSTSNVDKKLNSGIAQCVYFDAFDGQRRPFVGHSKSGASRRGKQSQKLQGISPLAKHEKVKYFTDHVCIDSLNSTISYIVTNKALSGRTKSIEVSTLPLLSGRNPGKEEKRVSAVQERLYKSKTAPPMETSMIILRELHRVATVEIESSPYADSSSQKGRMTTVYCDFSVTHMEQISDLLLFLSTWVTDSSSNSKKGDKVGLLLSLRWTLSLCTQCVLQCAQKQISEQMKSAVSNMMDILYDKVMIPCRTAWLKFPLLREEIQTSCVKILFAAPGLYFLECNKVEYARTLLIRAFQRNDTPFINVVSKLWSVNPSHSWLELAGAILRSGDGPIPFFDVLVKSCTGADSKNLSAITGVAGPRISSNLNVLLCFHKVFLSQAFANDAAVATPSSAARSVKVLYSPKYSRTTYKKAQTALQEASNGPYVLKASNGFPTWKASNVLLTEGKWYYEIEICGDDVKGYPQVGWASSDFDGGDGENKGVGDDSCSWGIDGERVCTWNKETNHENRKYGKKWSVGDRIGCAINLDNKSMEFYVNNLSQGVAYENINVSNGVCPAFTFSGRNCRLFLKLYFGNKADPFKYSPPEGHKSIHSSLLEQSEKETMRDNLSRTWTTTDVVDYFGILCRECSKYIDSCSSASISYQDLPPTSTASAVLPSVALLVCQQSNSMLEPLAENLEAAKSLLGFFATCSKSFDQFCSTNSSAEDVGLGDLPSDAFDLDARSKMQNPTKLAWPVHLKTILVLSVNRLSTRLATAQVSNFYGTHYWLDSVLFGNSIVQAAPVNDFVESILNESGKGYEWLLWCRTNRPRVGMQYRLLKRSEKTKLLNIEALVMAALLRHAPEHIFMHAQLQSEIISQGEDDKEVMARSHDALQPLWIAAWSVVSETRHIVNKLSEWKHLFRSEPGGERDEKMVGFVESLNRFEKMHLWVCTGKEPIEISSLDNNNQYMSRLCALSSETPSIFEGDDSKCLDVVFGLMDSRAKLIIELKPAPWRVDKLPLDRRSFQNVTSTPKAGFKRTNSRTKQESFKRQDSSSATVKGRSSRDWSRVVTSLKRSPSSINRGNSKRPNDTNEHGVDIEFYEQIAKFFKSSCDPNQLRDSIQLRRKAAHARLAGIQGITSGLTHYQSNTSKFILLASLGRNTQFSWGSAILKPAQNGVFFSGHPGGKRVTVPHILNGIRGCGLELEKELNSAYFDLINHSVKIACDRVMPIYTRCEALQVLGVGFLPDDFSLIQKYDLVSNLANIVSEMRADENYSEDKLSLQRESWEILLLISKSILASSGKLDLKEQLLRALLRLLEESANQSSASGHRSYRLLDGRQTGEVSTLIWARVQRRELEVQQNVSVLYIHRNSFLQSDGGVEYGKNAVRSCLKLLIHARGPYSTRTTRAALRFLSSCLQHISPKVISQFSETNSEGQANDLWLPLLLLEALGALTLGTGGLGTRDGACSAGGSGHGTVSSEDSPVKDRALELFARSIKDAFSSFPSLTEMESLLSPEDKNGTKSTESNIELPTSTVLEDDLLWDNSVAEQERENTMNRIASDAKQDFKNWIDGPAQSSSILPQPEVWEVAIDKLNVRREPSMDHEPIGRHRRGTQLKVVDKIPAEGIPKGQWLRLQKAESGHGESWVLSRNKDHNLLKPVVRKTYSVVLYNPSNESPDIFMARTNDIVRLAIAHDVNGEGCNWPSRGWDSSTNPEGQFIETCVQGMRENGRGLIMRNCSKIECETVAARLACQRFVTCVIDNIPKREKTKFDRNLKLAENMAKRPSSWYGGYASMSAAMEIVKMLRFLVSGVDAENDAPGDHRARMSWAHGTCRAISKAYADFNSGATGDDSVTARAYGALLVLGGLTTGGLHLGSTVQVVTGPQSHSEGILVRYNAGETTADVLLRDHSVVETFDIVAVQPTESAQISEDITLNSESVTLNLYPTLRSILEGKGALKDYAKDQKGTSHRSWLVATFVTTALRVLGQLQQISFTPVLMGVQTDEMSSLLKNIASLRDEEEDKAMAEINCFSILSTAAGDISCLEELAIDARQQVLDMRHGFQKTLMGVSSYAEVDKATFGLLKHLFLPRGFNRFSAMGTILHQETGKRNLSFDSPITVVQDGFLSKIARPTKASWPKASHSIVIADNPIPAYLNNFYFEIEVRKSDNTNFALHNLSGFFVGLWVGNATSIEAGTKEISADVADSVWYHPGNGKSIVSGKVRPDLCFEGVPDLKKDLATVQSIVIGCGWDLVNHSVFFTLDGSRINSKAGERRDSDNPHKLSPTSVEGFVYPAVRFLGNSGLKAKIMFGNNSSKFLYKFPPKIGVQKRDIAEGIQIFKQWLEYKTSVTNGLPNGVEGSENEVSKLLIKEQCKSARKNIVDAKACINARRVALELRQILAQHSVSVLMLLAQRYNLQNERAITAAFEHPNQMVDMQNDVDSGTAFAQYDDNSHLEVLSTEEFLSHKLLNSGDVDFLKYPGLEGPSIIANFKEDGVLTNSTEMEKKWCVVLIASQKKPFQTQISELVEAGVLGILWIVDTDDKVTGGKSNLLAELEPEYLSTLNTPLLLLRSKGDTELVGGNYRFRFSIGLRPTKPPAESGNEKKNKKSGIEEVAETAPSNGKFSYLMGGSLFCTTDEDAEERVAIIANEQEAKIELWLAEMHRWLSRSQGIDMAQISGIISHLRNGDPDGIATMTLDGIEDKKRMPKKPEFDSEKFSNNLGNTKVRIDDVRIGLCLRVTEQAKANMDGPKPFCKGNIVRFVRSSALVDYRVDSVNADGTLSISLNTRDKRPLQLHGVQERHLAKVNFTPGRVSSLSQSRIQRQSSSNPSVRWLSSMSICLRRTGIVRRVDKSDKEHPLVLLEFYDPETLGVCRWWFPISSLTYPAERVSSYVESLDEAVVYERALTTMYARNILVNSWSQRNMSITYPSSPNTNVSSGEEKFVLDYVVDSCFGPVHALLERSGANAVTSSGYVAPESPNDLIEILSSQLHTLFKDKMVESAFRDTYSLLQSSSVDVNFSAKKFKNAVSEVFKIAAKCSINNLSCLIMHVGKGTILPKGTALCVYSNKQCSQQYRLRRSQDLGASNCAQPIWCCGTTSYARFEGRSKRAKKSKGSNSDKKRNDPHLCAKVHQVSTKFWFGCWMVEQMLCQGEEMEGAQWCTYLLDCTVNLMDFVTGEHCMPTLRSICLRLLSRLFQKLNVQVDFCRDTLNDFKRATNKVPLLLEEVEKLYQAEAEDHKNGKKVAGGALHSSHLQVLVESVSAAYILMKKCEAPLGVPSYVMAVAKMIELCQGPRPSKFSGNLEDDGACLLSKWFVEETLKVAPISSEPEQEERDVVDAEPSKDFVVPEQESETVVEPVDDEEEALQLALMMSMAQMDDGGSTNSETSAQQDISSEKTKSPPTETEGDGAQGAKQKEVVSSKTALSGVDLEVICGFSYAVDEALVLWINRLVDSGTLEDGRSSAESLFLEDDTVLPLIDQFPQLSGISKKHLSMRMKVLEAFNDLYEEIIHFVDLNEFHTDSLPSKLFSRRYVIFSDIKMRLWQKSLNATAHSETNAGIKKVQIDRVKAANSKADQDGLVFEQLRSQLTNVASWQVRPPAPSDDILTHMCFEPDMLEEMDDGGASGPYREVFATLCNELQSDQADLNILLRQEEDGTFVLNPRGGTPGLLQKYEFLGSLIGMALRTHVLMPLDLSEDVWKPFTHESNRVPEEPSNKTDLELDDYPGEMVEQAAGFGGSDHDVIVDAIHVGMSRVVPTQWLRTFTWNELKRLLCGEYNIDIELLKRHTKYHENVDEQAQYIKWFWETLDSFTQEEKSRFVQFAYAQPRLPGNDEEWKSTRTLRMRIMPPPQHKSKPMKMDLVLPTAQTCFFDVHLPNYSSYEVMRRNLLRAIMS